MGYLDEQGNFIVKDEQAQSEIMKQYLFLHDNRKEWLSY